jgi:hypothetical protein
MGSDTFKGLLLLNTTALAYLVLLMINQCTKVNSIVLLMVKLIAGCAAKSFSFYFSKPIPIVYRFTFALEFSSHLDN